MASMMAFRGDKGRGNARSIRSHCMFFGSLVTRWGQRTMAGRLDILVRCVGWWKFQCFWSAVRFVSGSVRYFSKYVANSYMIWSCFIYSRSSWGPMVRNTAIPSQLLPIFFKLIWPDYRLNASVSQKYMWSYNPTSHKRIVVLVNIVISSLCYVSMIQTRCCFSFQSGSSI